MRGGVVGLHATPIVFLCIRYYRSHFSLKPLFRSSTSPATNPVGGRARPPEGEGGHTRHCMHVYVLHALPAGRPAEKMRSV